MLQSIQAYKNNEFKKHLLQVILVVFALITVFASYQENWPLVILFASLTVAGVIGFPKHISKQKEKILQQFEQAVNEVPIERKKVKKVTLEGDFAYIVFENGDLTKKQVEVVKTHVKELFFESREKPTVLVRVPELENKFPRPILFIPKKPNENVIIKEQNNDVQNQSN